MPGCDVQSPPSSCLYGVGILRCSLQVAIRGRLSSPEETKNTDGSSSCGAAADPGSETKVVNLDDDDPVAFWAMVQYLYNLEYPEPTEEVEQKVLRVETQTGSSSSEGKPGEPAKVYSLGEKYGLPGLKQFSSRRFAASLKGTHASVSGLVAVVREAYTATPEHDRVLRGKVKSILRKNMKTVEREQMMNLMLEIPQVAVDVLMDYYRHNPSRVAASRTSAVYPPP